MSQVESPSAQRPYGLARVCRVWRLPRSSAQLLRHRRTSPAPTTTPPRRGPRNALTDQQILDAVREALQETPFVGEGHRKVWAYLRSKDIRTRRERVLDVMRENQLLAPSRRGSPPGPRAHDGTIVTDRPDLMWGTDATGTLTEQGFATIFLLVDHCTGECLGIHAARRGTRFEALEPVRQPVRHSFGAFAKDIARTAGLRLRHDHGSQFTSHAFQQEIAFLGIESSPSFVRSPEGNGCAERFVRTLKEQLLWLRRFATVEELVKALHEFRQTYNERWILQRHDYLTPAQVRAKLLAAAKAA